MIKILIADDSATQVLLLKQMFDAEKDMCVIGIAFNGKEAVNLTASLKPDLITMAIQMPLMNSFEAIKVIMMENPTPIIVISSTINNSQFNTTCHALEAGAISVIDKPNAFEPSFEPSCQRIIQLIRVMAGINVIKRRFNTPYLIQQSPLTVNLKSPPYQPYKILAIGASVGGPQALKLILSQMPANYPLPIVIVQHITAGFLDGLCQWLNEHCPQSIRCATQDEQLNAGTVYFAPEHCHMTVKCVGNQLVSCLEQGRAVAGFYPSITVLFQSIAKTCTNNAIGLLLTGMGHDGAQGLLELKQRGAHTLIQDEKSCVVYGMAGVAESLGAVDKIIALEKLAYYLTTIT